MLLIIVFFLGIANFAANKAVLDSNHVMLDRLPGIFRSGALPLAAEFIVLAGAMLMIANGWPGVVWAYGLYSCVTLGSAWAILTDRI